MAVDQLARAMIELADFPGELRDQFSVCRTVLAPPGEEIPAQDRIHDQGVKIVIPLSGGAAIRDCCCDVPQQVSERGVGLEGLSRQGDQPSNSSERAFGALMSTDSLRP